MNPLLYLPLISTMILGTIITMTSHHWLFAWVGLEINTLAMVPLIAEQHHPRATEAAMKYFMIQATTASMILFAGTINAKHLGQWTITTESPPLALLLLTVALLTKLGLAPTHVWYQDVLHGATLTTALILATWQKLAPLTLLLMLHTQLPTEIFLVLGTLSALVGGWGGLNQTQLRKIMAYSSISHMGWLTTAIVLNESLSTLALSLYLITTTSLFLTLISTTTKTLSDLATTWTTSPPLLTTMMLSLLSLGGLPPLTGFSPKWMIINQLTTMNFNTLATTLLMASLPSLFFYLRMAYLSTLTTPPGTVNHKHKWQLSPHPTKLLATTHTLAILLLPTLPLL